MTSVFVNGGIALLAAMVHATLSLSLVWLAFRHFRLSPVSREWMLRAALILPLVMAGRSLAKVVPGEARVRAAFAELAAEDSDLALATLPLGQGEGELWSDVDQVEASWQSVSEHPSTFDMEVRTAAAGLIGTEPHLGGVAGEAFRVVRVLDEGGPIRTVATSDRPGGGEGVGLARTLEGAAPMAVAVDREIAGGANWFERLERDVTLVPARAAWVGWALWLAGLIWLAGMAVQMGRSGRSAFAVRRLVAGSLPPSDGLAAEVSALGRSVGVGNLSVRIVEGLGSPFAASGGRLVLPDWIEQIPRAQRHAILAHEIAHLRRHDPLVQAALVPIKAALWPHPLLRWALLEMRQAVEHRCDDEAIESTDRMTLARALAEVAERLHAGQALSVAGPLAVSGAPISDRIGRALSGDRGGQAWIAATCGVILIALTALLPPPEPGPEYHLKVVQTHQIIEGTADTRPNPVVAVAGPE